MVVEAAQQRADHHLDLGAGEAGAETEVRTAAAERDVRIR